MKLKMLAFMLSMNLLLGILTGCTPKTQDSTESYTVPNIESGTEQLPENETAAPTGEPVVTEPRRVKAGDQVVVGRADDGSNGVFVHANNGGPR